MADLKHEDLVKLREIAEKATPDVWFSDFYDEVCAILDGGKGAAVIIAQTNTMAELTPEAAEANTRHIAAFSPAVCLSLLADRARMVKETADKVANAYYEGAMAALGRDWWEDGPDYFALVGQGYAAGKPLPSTMPKRRAEGVAALQQPGQPGKEDLMQRLAMELAGAEEQSRPVALLKTTELREIISALQQAGEPVYRVGDFIGRQPVLCEHGSTDPNNLCPKCEDGEPPSPLPQQTALVEGQSPELDEINGRLA